MAHQLLRDAQAYGWERSDVPSVSGSCFGDNPYVRTMRAEYDKECKICARPFTVFCWRPSRDARYKNRDLPDLLHAEKCARSAYLISIMVFQFRFETQHSLQIQMMQFQGVM